MRVTEAKSVKMTPCFVYEEKKEKKFIGKCQHATDTTSIDLILLFSFEERLHIIPFSKRIAAYRF